MYQAVIFDMDGVIIDSEPIHFRMMKKYLEELGIQISEEEWNEYTGMANKEIFASLKLKYDLQQTAEDLTTVYMARYIDFLNSAKGIKPIAGVVALIREIHGIGLPLALASSASPKNIAIVLEKFQLGGYFEIAVSGCNMAASKPAPDIYFHVAEMLKVNPSECVVIEDSTNGLKAAKAAGMACIAYSNPNSGKQDLSLADAVIDSFEGCDFVKLLDEI